MSVQWCRNISSFLILYRYILSFPTRRSSDLERTTRDDFAAAILSAMDSLGVERAHICGLSLGGVIAIAMHAWQPKDRKSTRLNSSHPSISYAVFCMKKKMDISYNTRTSMMSN